KDKDGRPIPLPMLAIAVANKHLFVANDLGLLKSVLLKTPTQETSTRQTDFQRVDTELHKLELDKISLQFFARPAQAARGPYELVRTDRLALGRTPSTRV